MKKCFLLAFYVKSDVQECYDGFDVLLLLSCQPVVVECVLSVQTAENYSKFRLVANDVDVGWDALLDGEKDFRRNFCDIITVQRGVFDRVWANCDQIGEQSFQFLQFSYDTWTQRGTAHSHVDFCLHLLYRIAQYHFTAVQRIFDFLQLLLDWWDRLLSRWQAHEYEKHKTNFFETHDSWKFRIATGLFRLLVCFYNYEQKGRGNWFGRHEKVLAESNFSETFHVKLVKASGLLWLFDFGFGMTKQSMDKQKLLKNLNQNALDEEKKVQIYFC
jgi:hypothetical protein